MGTTLMTWRQSKVCLLSLLICMSVVLVACSVNEENEPLDPKAEEALELVRTHPARQASTIEQALQDIVEEMEEKGQPVRMGEWRVAQEAPDVYVVSMLILEKGVTGWIERDYAWRVDLKDKFLRVITLPATHVMPFHELPPLPMDPANF